MMIVKSKLFGLEVGEGKTDEVGTGVEVVEIVGGIDVLGIEVIVNVADGVGVCVLLFQSMIMPSLCGFNIVTVTILKAAL